MSRSQARDQFRLALRELRKRSLWPDVGAFADQVGLSLGGYKKYEEGHRLPSNEVLNQIFVRARFQEQERLEIYKLWNLAKGEQAGVTIVERPKIEADKLTARVVSEATYILKQRGFKLDEKTERILFNRIRMLLSATE
jgi:transcriptional regulator with XRE-family HTH domain